MNYQNNSRGSKGFTLIELAAAIVIIGLLAVSAVSLYSDLQEAADQAQIEATAGALQAGMTQVRTDWMIQGAQGNGSNTRTDLVVDGIDVRFRNGFPVTTNNSNHVPNGTPNRGSAASRLFHLFLSRPPEIIARNSDGPGWAMLANGQCAAVSRQRCWEFRRNDQRVARITYSGGTGAFIID